MGGVDGGASELVADTGAEHILDPVSMRDGPREPSVLITLKECGMVWATSA